MNKTFMKKESSATKGCSWDPQRDFLEEYIPLMEKVRVGDETSYSKVRALRVKEYGNTIAIANQGYYYTADNQRVELSAMDKIAEGTRFYSSEFNVEHIAPSANQTIIEVSNADCMAEGIRLLNMGYNPAILNMASRQIPGGGVAYGMGAQEETIFRRSNLFHSLYRFVPYAEDYGVQKAKEQYPMYKDFGGIYSPNITIFREEEANGYRLMDNPRQVAFISVAAMNRPKLTKDMMIDESLIEGVKNKMRTILRIGLQHGHDSLVLGALGCGAYRNPPKHIAKLFHEVLAEQEFENKYRYIVFAVLEDHNSRKRHNPEGNYIPFKLEFE